MRRFYFILLLIIGFGINNVYACMCMQENISDAFKSAKIIVTAKVLQIENPIQIDIKADENFKGNTSEVEFMDEYTASNGEKRKIYIIGKYQKSKLKVLKTFKGDTESEIKIKQEKSTCDWHFDEEKDVNKKYLFYLYQNDDGTYSVTSCGRSTPLEKGYDDISWLNDLPNSLYRNRISGTVNLDDDTNTFPPVKGIKITISGINRVIKLVTDKNGLYEVWDLPEGKYQIKADVPNNFVIDWISNLEKGTFSDWEQEKLKDNPFEFDLKSATSTGINFMLEKKKNEK